MNDWWKNLGKETAAYCLAFVIVGAWLSLIFLKRDEAPTLTNVIMIIVGYIYGSSTMNKSKDDTISTMASKAMSNGQPEKPAESPYTVKP